MNRPKSVNEWLAAHEWLNEADTKSAFVIIKYDDGTVVCNGPATILETSSTYVDATMSPCGIIRYRYDPNCDAPALSAPASGGTTALLFHDKPEAMEYADRLSAMENFRDKSKYYTARASAMMLNAAMACLRGGIPEADLLRILGQEPTVPRAPGKPFGLFLDELPDNVFADGEKDLALKLWEEGRLYELERLANTVYFREADKNMDDFDTGAHAACMRLSNRVENECRAFTSIAYDDMAEASADGDPRTAIAACRALHALETHDPYKAYRIASRIASGEFPEASERSAELARHAADVLAYIIPTRKEAGNT